MRRRRRDASGAPELVELAALADGSLAPERRAALEARVAESSELAELLTEQERAVAFARSAAAEVQAPETLRARVPATEPGRSRLMRPRLVVISAAASAVLAVGIALAIFQSDTSGTRFHATLGPTELMPRADGGATLRKTPSGWRIDLDATGLPRLDAGRFYQAWLRNDAGMLVPIGTFNDGRNVTLWAGVSPEDFRTLTVTRERADGNQASSGEKVLVGTVSSGG